MNHILFIFFFFFLFLWIQLHIDFDHLPKKFNFCFYFWILNLRQRRTILSRVAWIIFKYNFLFFFFRMVRFLWWRFILKNKSLLSLVVIFWMIWVGLLVLTKNEITWQFFLFFLYLPVLFILFKSLNLFDTRLDFVNILFLVLSWLQNIFSHFCCFELINLFGSLMNLVLSAHLMDS